MLNKQPTNDQIDYAKYLLKDTPKIWRGKVDGDPEQRLIGHIAQIIICDEFGCKRPNKYNGYDGGTDVTIFNKKFDIKTELRNVDFRLDFVHNVLECQMKYLCDGYIFVSFNKEKNEFTICGYITKENFLTNATFFKKGDKRARSDGSFMKAIDNYREIKQKHLLPIEILKGEQKTLNILGGF